MRRIMIGALAGALALSACGGSSSSEGKATAKASEPAAATEAPTTAAPATTAAATTAAPTTAAPTTAAPTTAAPAPTDPAVTEVAPDATGDVSFTGDGSGEYCEFARRMSDSTAFDDAFNSTDPVAAKAQFEELIALLDEATGKAPDEIKGDAVTVTEFFKNVAGAYDKYDYDVTKLATAVAGGTEPELAALFGGAGDPKFEEASNRLSAYDEQVCGLAS